MIDEIKKVVQNFLNNAMLSDVLLGKVENDGIRVSDKLVVPNELIEGNFKKTIIAGDSVRLLRGHGGQKYYILEVVAK